MKVLVAIDNRPSSQATIDALVKMHWYEGTEIAIVTVLDSDADPASANSTIEEMENVAVELRNALRDCEVSFFARTGSPETAILQVAEQIGAELIVVGSNCKSTLEKLILGSVCQRIVNNAGCPVIVAKTPCCLAREASPGFRNILVPVDNSVFSDVAVQWLANFQWAPETRFIVAAVVEGDTDIEQVKQNLTARGTGLAQLLNTDNVTIDIVGGKPSQSIINLSKKYYADLIVMGSHGHTRLKELILGSVSHEVSHAAPCAVAIVRSLHQNDESAHRSGAFPKLKPVVQPVAVQSFRRSDDSDLSVHTMPGGF
jgi:nucleotide-binding universal stress UspA family protein